MQRLISGLSHVVATTLVVLLALSSPAFAQQSQSTTLNVRNLMTDEEFKGAGLHKLTSAEMGLLNAWVQRLAKSIFDLSASGVQSSGQVIESQIGGTFNGWDGETVFKLTNGQIWQQSSYAYTYHYAYRPDVMIYRSGGGYKMKVDDVDDEISVRRLK